MTGGGTEGTGFPPDDEALAPLRAILHGDTPPPGEMFEHVYLDVQRYLDEVLGTGEEDGAGAGLEADVRLLGTQRDEARAEVTRLRSALAGLEGAINWRTSCLSCSRVLDSAAAETFRRERAEAALEIAREALHRLSLIDEMAGMGQRDGDPELTARCRRAQLALADMDNALEADVQAPGEAGP